MWRKKFNKKDKLQKKMGMALVISFIRGQMVQWLVNVIGNPRGWPRKRWFDIMEGDLDKMGVQKSKELVQD